MVIFLTALGATLLTPPRTPLLVSASHTSPEAATTTSAPEAAPVSMQRRLIWSSRSLIKCREKTENYEKPDDETTGKPEVNNGKPKQQYNTTGNRRK